MEAIPFSAHPAPLSKILFAAGMGALLFSFFRLCLLAPFEADQVYFAAWEEITELLYIASAAGAVFLLRRALFPERPDRQMHA